MGWTKPPIPSSMINGYELKGSDLTVEFKNGKRYIYKDISKEQYEELHNADSVGSHFSKHFKHLPCSLCEDDKPAEKGKKQ